MTLEINKISHAIKSVLDEIISNELGMENDWESQDTTQDSDSEWLPAGKGGVNN